MISPNQSDKKWHNLPEATALSREDAFQMHRRTAVRTASLLRPEYSAYYPTLCKLSEQTNKYEYRDLASENSEFIQHNDRLSGLFLNSNSRHGSYKMWHDKTPMK